MDKNRRDEEENVTQNWFGEKITQKVANFFMTLFQL